MGVKMRLSKILKNIKINFILVIILQFSPIIFAQENESNFNRDTIITAARKMMETARYCALITLDETGHPTARTMDPFLPEDNMVVWLGTNINSKKVQEIKNDSRVTLYYQSPNEVGYVLIKGHAFLVDDTLMKQKFWKNEWSRFYSKEKSNYTLIKIIPDKLEIIDYQHGISGDIKTWTAPYVKFDIIKSN
jgi:general stress protein 26